MEGPPVIDAQGFLAPEAAGTPPPADMCAAIAQAAESWGFFQLVNHGADGGLVARLDAAMRAFFALPLQAKLQVRRSADNAMGFAHDELTKQARDLKEVFDCCRTPHPELPDDHPSNRTLDGYNRWPAGQEEFRAALRAYFAEMERCSFRLLEAFCGGLGLPPAALHPLFQGEHTSFLRLNYYPPADAEEAQQAQRAADGGEPLGVHHHTDAGFLTILVQDPQVPGLQMLGRDGRWLLVQPLPGALTINVGDQAQVLSNDRWRAPVHRVLASAPGRPRYSAPFFFNPAAGADIAPLPRFIDAAHPPCYRPINWGAFRAQRFAGDYADQGEEVQIGHYRLDAPPAAAPAAPPQQQQQQQQQQGGVAGV